MNYNLNMPLSGLVAKLLRGEADELHEEDLCAYMDHLTHGDKKGLQQVLEKLDRIVKEEYVFSVYEEKLSRYKPDMTKENFRDFDDLHFEEEALRKEGKVVLSVNFLYDSIMKMGGIMEAHQEVIEDAYRVGNIDYLYVQWKDLVMEPQIRSLKAVVNDMLKQYQ